MKWIERIASRLHRHSWDGSAWNPYCVEMEQRCMKCFTRRHRIGFGSDEWIDGPHPIAQGLRAQGKARTDDWSGAW